MVTRTAECLVVQARILRTHPCVVLARACWPTAFVKAQHVARVITFLQRRISNALGGIIPAQSHTETWAPNLDCDAITA